MGHSSEQREREGGQGRHTWSSGPRQTAATDINNLPLEGALPAPIIDTHCHIAGKEFDADRAEVLARAWGAGLSAIIVIGAGDGVEGNRRALELAQTDSRLFATVGIHPHDAVIACHPGEPRIAVRGRRRDPVKMFLDSCFRRNDKSFKIVAIGETGLDYHYDHSPREAQQQGFREQIQLAQKYNLPLVIHSREAWEDTLRVLKETGITEKKGVFHCFGGTMQEAEEGLALGFYISIPGIITFKKPGDLLEVAKNIPLEKMLIETDAPFLAPVPFRGKRNEPAFVKFIAEKIAEIRGVSYEEVVKQTTENARQLFDLSL